MLRTPESRDTFATFGEDRQVLDCEVTLPSECLLTGRRHTPRTHCSSSGLHS